MNNELDKESLLAACIALADRTVPETESRDVLEMIGNEYFDCAMTYERRFKFANRVDVNLLVSAVWFIAESLAFGEIGRNVRWFDATLDGVIELLIPTRGVTKHGGDLRRRARIALDLIPDLD